jgi:hypothetical protein
MKPRRLLTLLCLSVIVVVGTGCAQVKPWQRGALADYTLRADRDPLSGSLNEHLWSSREAASGGKAVGGGGCGCN